MGFFFGSVFWGIVLILAGASVILRSVFNIYIPVFRIVLAVIIIYFGVRMLLGHRVGYRDRSNIVFQERTVHLDGEQEEYNVIFGRGEIDLRDVVLQDAGGFMEINVIFGGADLIIDSEMPLKIKATTIFGDTKFPRGSSSPFGDTVYRSANYEEGAPHLTLETNVIFGSLRVIAKRD